MCPSCLALVVVADVLACNDESAEVGTSGEKRRKIATYAIAVASVRTASIVAA